MNDIRKERLILLIMTLAASAIILQIWFGNWEFWVIPVLIVGALVLWFLHFRQRADFVVRCNIYFVYGAFLAFFVGVHSTALFDISVAFMLLIGVYSLLDRMVLINLAIIEYGVIMVYVLATMYQKNELELTAFYALRIIFHIGCTVSNYIYCRMVIKRRISERQEIDDWREAVAGNDRDMEDFLTNISHELRTPVNVISGMTTILQKEGDRKELDAIREAGIRLAHQIEDIQDFTELKRGELRLEEDNYMCVSLVNDVVANYQASEKRHNLELVVDLDPATPTLLCGDIVKLHKLFRHLLDNALKFTRRGGVYIRVFPIRQEYGINLTIEITDTGIGMTRAGIASVSRGMYQANKKRNRSTGGIGIGLPIVYGFVHKMGGFVHITSTKGAGTTVRLSIPQKVVDPLPCLALKEDAGDILFYLKPEKYKIPAIREFHKTMAVNLATGLRVPLYAVGNKMELDKLMDTLHISYIFTGAEEYMADKEILDELAKKNIRVVVSADAGTALSLGSGVIRMPKPLYGFPVVRIINGETAGFEKGSDGKPRFTGLTALVVDDEPMNLVVATGLFREYEMVTDTADSGKEALKKYEAADYDVIFMDHMMPEMDGVETQKRIRQIAAETGRKPLVIALTANALSGAKEMFMREGFDGFIAKPIDISEFERVMKNLLPDEKIHFEGRDES